MERIDFVISIVGSKEFDLLNDNVDVEVKFSDGSRYTATFFTLHNIHSLFLKNRRTGECCNGIYMWATGMIIVENLDEHTLKKTVDSLIRNGEFESAFGGPH